LSPNIFNKSNLYWDGRRYLGFGWMLLIQNKKQARHIE
jgi:hypothetical protein